MDGNTTSSVFMAKVFQKDGKCRRRISVQRMFWEYWQPSSGSDQHFLNKCSFLYSYLGETRDIIIATEDDVSHQLTLSCNKCNCRCEHRKNLMVHDKSANKCDDYDLDSEESRELKTHNGNYA